MSACQLINEGTYAVSSYSIFKEFFFSVASAYEDPDVFKCGVSHLYSQGSTPDSQEACL